MEKFDSLRTVFDKFCVGYFPKISRDVQILIKNPSKITHAVYVCLFTSVTISVTTVNSALVFTVVFFLLVLGIFVLCGYQLYQWYCGCLGYQAYQFRGSYVALRRHSVTFTAAICTLDLTLAVFFFCFSTHACRGVPCWEVDTCYCRVGKRGEVSERMKPVAVSNLCQAFFTKQKREEGLCGDRVRPSV